MYFHFVHHHQCNAEQYSVEANAAIEEVVQKGEERYRQQYTQHTQDVRHSHSPGTQNVRHSDTKRTTLHGHRQEQQEGGCWAHPPSVHPWPVYLAIVVIAAAVLPSVDSIGIFAVLCLASLLSVGCLLG
jgi:hypothetical protein